MFSRIIKKKSAFTLIESIVATVVFTIVAYGIYQAWSHITFNQAVAEARGQAKSDVEIITRNLERDISMARAGTIAGNSGDDGITLTITRKTAGGQPKDVIITYSRDGNEFTRTEDNNNNLLTRNLKEFNWIREVTASGVIYLTTTVEVPVRGFDTVQTHKQESMATIREEAIGAGDDSRWKRSGDLLENW
jgi:prepilin-type N-terminal cleavage/methylation domain-containing protein